MSTNLHPFPPHSSAPPTNVSSFPTYAAAHALPSTVAQFKQRDVEQLVQFLIKGIVEIKDTTGDFLLRLDDGRVIDTKGWSGKFPTGAHVGRRVGADAIGVFRVGMGRLGFGNEEELR